MPGGGKTAVTVFVMASNDFTTSTSSEGSTGILSEVACENRLYVYKMLKSIYRT